MLQNVSRQEMWGFSGKSRDFRFRDHQGSRLGTSCLFGREDLDSVLSSQTSWQLWENERTVAFWTACGSALSGPPQGPSGPYFPDLQVSPSLTSIKTKVEMISVSVNSNGNRCDTRKKHCHQFSNATRRGDSLQLCCLKSFAPELRRARFVSPY